ncbi:hypothetical protein HPT25_19675 [Bacillus sp. BRMEA1]|uniref:CBO0543 family protein n=1 Tax=Neobacillus endophyticus TaxID=2738405 RepID=UPI0015648D76|nr:CBO0543 family protein [Neobacillus endophyticus]NRD79584.1 hypothetical protein [Neobacillus endophyticus]
MKAIRIIILGKKVGVSPIFEIILSVIFLLAAWRWGDWKNFFEYYPTLLYVAIGNLTYKLVALYQFHLWKTTDGNFFNAEISFFIQNFLVIIPLIFVYLSKFPEKRKEKIHYVIGWSLILFLLEWIGAEFFQGFKYYHGWNIWWSLLFDIQMFTMLRLHFVNYKIAILLSVPCTLFWLICFDYI